MEGTVASLQITELHNYSQPSEKINGLLNSNGEKPACVCQCGKKFTKRTNLTRHQRKAGHVDNVGKLLCPVVQCSRRFPYMSSLCWHVKVEHKIMESVIDVRSFQDFEQFTAWKHVLEEETRCRYVQHEAAKEGVWGKRIYFYCHRSGQVYKAPYVSKKGLHVTKSRNRKVRKPLMNRGVFKMQATCTAHMSVVVDPESGKVNCKVCSLHIGHTNDHESRHGSCAANSVQPGRSATTSAPLYDSSFNSDDLVAQQLGDLPVNSIDDKLDIDRFVSKCRQLMDMVKSGTYTKKALSAAEKHLSDAKATLQIASQVRLSPLATPSCLASPTVQACIVSLATPPCTSLSTALTRLESPACITVTQKLGLNERVDRHIKFLPLLPKPPAASFSSAAAPARIATTAATFTLIASPAAPACLATPAGLAVTRKLAVNEKQNKQLKFRPLLPKPPSVQEVVIESYATGVAALTLASMTNDVAINFDCRNSTALAFDEVPYCVKNEEVVSST